MLRMLTYHFVLPSNPNKPIVLSGAKVMIISEMRKIYAVIFFFGCRGLFGVGSWMKKERLWLSLSFDWAFLFDERFLFDRIFLFDERFLFDWVFLFDEKVWFMLLCRIPSGS